MGVSARRQQSVGQFEFEEASGPGARFAPLGTAHSSAATGFSGFSRGSIGEVFGKPEVGTSEILVLPEADFAFGSHIDKSAGGTFAPPIDFDPANVAGAISVPDEILVNGTISGNEIDGFGFNLVAGRTYMFSVYGSGATPLADSLLFLRDPTGNFIDGGYGFFNPPRIADDDGGSGTNSLFTFTATITGTHVIGVAAFPGSGTGTYTLDAVLQPLVDVVPDTFAGAAPIVLGTTQYGFIEAGPSSFYTEILGIPGLIEFGEIDTFTFTAEAGMLYSIEVAGGADYNSFFADLPPGEIDPVIVIYDANGNFVTLNDDISFPGDISSRVSFFAEEGGQYFVDIFSYQPWSGGYSITSRELNPADFNPLDAITWFSASNVPFDATETAYVYFAPAGVNFGESDDGVTPLPSFGWNDYEIGQVMLALEEYEKILGVNYEITTDVNQATFRLITTVSELYGAYMYPQDAAFGTQQGIAVFNIDSGAWAADQQQSLEQGGFAFGVILHEFGHGHGLAHPHDNGGGSEILLGVTGPFDSLGIYDLNQGVYTVMSYNDAWQLHPDGPTPFNVLADVDHGWSGTLSALDIAALQRRYGANNSYATGNDVYRLQDTNTRGTYYQTIWDTGGRDTIRYDGARNARIDLLAATIDYTPTGGGVVSFVDDIWGGFTIAQGVVIEDATGGSGHDSLLGNAAANVLRGNAGDDILVGREGGDRLMGGAGFDTASYIDAGAGVVASLQDEEHNTGDAAGDTYSNVEALQGSRHNDMLDGNDGANRLDGLAGNDDLRGRDGADTLIGGAGDDTLRGDDGTDTLLGGAGNDTLNGGDGVDNLDGGAGNDVMSGGDAGDFLAGGGGADSMHGGDGRDTFVFNLGSGADTIDDFSRRGDKLDLTATGINWADLDSNGNGRLDDADAFVSVVGRDTIIDLGAAAGGAAGLDTLGLLRVTGLTEGDFLFGP